METYFENVGKPDIRPIAEMRYRIGSKSNWVWIGVYLLLGAYYLHSYFLGETLLLLPLICIGGAIYLLLRPYLLIRKSLKKEAAFYNGTIPEITVQFGDKIQMSDVDSSRTWEYHQMVKVYSFKYSYCLRFADRTVLLVDRANFTKGTFEEFKQFLRTKRPDLKIPE